MLGLAVALIVVVPTLGGGQDSGAGEPSVGPGYENSRTDDPAAGGAAAQPPTFDEVVEIRDELLAARSSDYPVDEASLAAVATAPGPYTPLGRIAFPTTGLDVEFAAGVHPSVLELGPGHWPGTAQPGQPGNGVISGHRTTFTHPFGDLDLLNPGDPILLTSTGASGPVEYRVTETSIVTEAEYAQFVLRQPIDPSARELTLFACHPKGQRTHRIVVHASA